MDILQKFRHAGLLNPLGLATIGYALFYYAFTDAARAFQVILFFGLIYSIYKNQSGIRSDIFVKLMYAVLIIQFVSWAYVRWTHPEWATQFPKLDKLTKLFFFLPIAYFMAKYQWRSTTLLILGFVGFLLGCLTHGEGLPELKMALSGKRVDFGIQNAQFTAMISATMLLSALVLGFGKIALKRPFQNQRFLISLIFLFIGFFGTIVSQTRQAWLALAISVVITVLLVVIFGKLGKKSVTLIGLTLLIFFVGLPMSNVFDRSQEAIETFSESFSTSNIPDTSTGIRLQSWLESIDWFLARPILGWSDEARALVISESETMSDFVKENFAHLHSSPVELLVCYGIIGFSLIMFMFVAIFKTAYDRRDLIKDGYIWLTYTFAFLIFWLVINLFESYMLYGRGVFIQVIVFAAIYANYLPQGDDVIESEAEAKSRAKT